LHYSEAVSYYEQSEKGNISAQYYFILIDNLVSKTPHDFVPNLKYLFIAGLLLSTPYKYIFLPTINQLCQW